MRASSLHFARLACIRHAASVRPEPGSNSPIKVRCAHFVVTDDCLLSIVIDVDIRHDSVQFSKNIRFLSPKRQDLIYHVSLLVAIHIFFQFEKEKIKTPFYRGSYNLATSYSPRAFTQVPLALKSLTSVFGMGTGVTSSPSLPDLEGLFLQN